MSPRLLHPSHVLPFSSRDGGWQGGLRTPWPLSLRGVQAAGCRQLPGHVWAAGCFWSGALEPGSAPEPRPPWEHPGTGFWEGQVTAGALPQYPVQYLCPCPGDTGDRAGMEEWCLGTEGQEGAGTGSTLTSHLSRFNDPPGAKWQPPTSKKTSSEAKSSLDVLGGGGCGCPAAPQEQRGWGSVRLRQPQAQAPQEPGAPSIPPSSWWVLIPSV